MSPLRIKRLDQSIEALLLGILVYLPLAFGGVGPSRRAPAFILAVLLLALTIFRLIIERDARLSLLKSSTFSLAIVPTAFFTVFLLVLLLQLAPLPRLITDFLGLRGMAAPGAFAPMHPAPETGFRTFLTYLTAFAVFFAIVGLYRTQAQVRRLVYTIIAVGVFEALYGMLEWISGHQHIYGYLKQAYTSSATGTFINRNHFAGCLEMTFAMLVSVITYAYLKSQKKVGFKHGAGEQILLMGFGLVLCTGAILASGSRAAPVALAASVLLAGLILVREQNRKKYFVAVIAVAVVALIFALWIGADPLNPRYKGLPEEVRAGDARPRVFLAALSMWLHAPVFGVGAGMFADAFPLFRPPSVLAFYDHAHNDYLEILAETGLAGFLALFSGAAFTVAATIRARRNRSSRFARAYSMGALVGVFSLALHGFVDFNLSIPANLTTFFALLALALISANRHLQR